MKFRVGALLTAVVLGCGTAVAQAEPVVGTVVDSGTYSPEKWVQGAVSGTEFTYTTRSSRGVDAVSSAVTFLPPGPAPEGGWPIVAWAHGTTGIADACAPSVTGLFARNPAFLASWLDRGFAVVATDYIGLGTPGVHPYLDARSEGNAVVDSVRAARSAVPSLSTRWAVVGQSQGGQAALAAANIATKYAPELDFRGAVATAPPSNIENLLGLARPELPPLPLTGLTTFMSYIIAGVRAEYPEIDPAGFLTPLGVRAADAAETLCYEDFGAAFPGVTVGQMFSKPVTDDPALAAAIREYLQLPTTGYDRPIFIGQSLVDTVVPAPLTLKLAADLQANSQPLTLRTYQSDHPSTATAALPDSIPFVEGLFR